MKKLLVALFPALLSLSSSYAQNAPPYFSQTIESFQLNQGRRITSHCQHLQMGKTHYYGVRIDEQMQMQGDPSQAILETRLLYQGMKRSVLHQMGLSPDTEVVQVVGNSSPFSVEGTIRAKEFLRAHLPVQAVVLYGYTGYEAADGARCVNAVVSEIMAERNQLDRTIGNLVGFHSPLSLEKWGYTGPALQHYIVVYGDDETCPERGTVFGDDVTTSDFFADRLLVLDGGIQTFRQICNALLLDQQIDVLSGLRTPASARVIDSNVDSTPYFVAAQFLKDITAFTLKKGPSLSAQDLWQWYQGYFGPGKCYVADPKKPAFSTKQKLLDEAWELFVKERLDRKLQILVKNHP